MATLVTDLDIYNSSLTLLSEVYLLCEKIPNSEYSTIDQIKRSAKSIPANISEGFGKRSSSKEFKRYLTIAMGSSDETITHLKIIQITIPFIANQTIKLLEEYSILSKRINKLRTNWFNN